MSDVKLEGDAVILDSSHSNSKKNLRIVLLAALTGLCVYLFFPMFVAYLIGPSIDKTFNKQARSNIFTSSLSGCPDRSLQKCSGRNNQSVAQDSNRVVNFYVKEEYVRKSGLLEGFIVPQRQVLEILRISIASRDLVEEFRYCSDNIQIVKFPTETSADDSSIKTKFYYLRDFRDQEKCKYIKEFFERHAREQLHNSNDIEVTNFVEYVKDLMRAIYRNASIDQSLENTMNKLGSVKSNLDLFEKNNICVGIDWQACRETLQDARQNISYVLEAREFYPGRTAKEKFYQEVVDIIRTWMLYAISPILVIYLLIKQGKDSYIYLAGRELASFFKII